MPDDLGSLLQNAIGTSDGPRNPSLLTDPQSGPSPGADANPQQMAQNSSDPPVSTSTLSIANAMRAAADATEAVGKLGAFKDVGGSGAQVVSLLQGQNADTTGAAVSAIGAGAAAQGQLTAANTAQINESNRAGLAARSALGGDVNDSTTSAGAAAADINQRVLESISLHRDIDDRLATSFFDDPLKYVQDRFGLAHQQERVASVDSDLSIRKDQLAGILHSQTEAFGIEDAAHKNVSVAQEAGQQAVIAADAQLKATAAYRQQFQAALPIEQLNLATRSEQFRETMDKAQLANSQASLALAERGRQFEEQKWDTIKPYYEALKNDQDIRTKLTIQTMQNKLGAEQADNLSLSMSPLLGQLNKDQLLTNKNPVAASATIDLAHWHAAAIGQNPGVDPNTLPYGFSPGYVYQGFKDAEAPLNGATRILHERLTNAVWNPQEAILSQTALGIKDSKDKDMRAAMFDNGVPGQIKGQSKQAPGVMDIYKQESADRNEKAGLYTLPSVRSILSTGPGGAVPQALANNSLVPGLRTISGSDPSRILNAQDIWDTARAILSKASTTDRPALLEKTANDVAGLMKYSNSFMQTTLNYGAYNLPVPSGYNKTVRTDRPALLGNSANIDWTNPNAVRNLLLQHSTDSATGYETFGFGQGDK